MWICPQILKYVTKHAPFVKKVPKWVIKITKLLIRFDFRMSYRFIILISSSCS